MMSQTPEFIRAAAELARSAPRQWGAFIEQLDRYAARKRDDCVLAPTDQLFVAQGRAQGVNTLVRDISEACKKQEAADGRR
jgi:hypothetical protein